MAAATDFSVRERAFAVLFSALTLVAVAAPLLYGKDDFPLSNYPMFSKARPAVARVYHVVGFSKEGNHRPLPPAAVGTDEIMQAWQTVKLAIKRGAPGSSELCEKAAVYVAEHEEFSDLEWLDVRVDWFDTVAYWKGDRKPRKSQSLARCPVPRESRG
jgi:hypothetical protein